jgi:two-component system sensor histidine kinase TctE
VVAPQGQVSALQQQLEGLKNRQEPVLLRYTNGKLEVLETPSAAPAGPTWLWAGVLLAGAWLAGAWGIRRSLGPLYTLAAEIARRGPTRLDALEPPPLPELRPAVTALNKLLEELRGTLSRLELQEQSARRFAYNASHELRNPLTAARNYLEVLTRYPNEREAGVKALKAVQRTEKVLGSLLTLARLEGRGRVRGEAVDVRSFLEANFELRVVGDATVWAERDLLELAVDNIVKNAEDHASGIRQARIETTPSGVWLWLEDDGPGFAPEIMSHAFEPFVRGGPNNSGSSTGLGLAIVDAVARAHGGEVRAENRADGGARVGLRLPSGSI